MIQKLIDNHYLIIKNFISSRRAKKLSEEFKEYCKTNNIKDDLQIPNTPAKYNYISFLELLCEKTSEVSKTIGEKVLPTYCYSRVYKKNDVLTKHKDRDACEISLTVHLDGDTEWEIYIETPSKKEVPVKLSCGDALLYLGCDAPHWRNSYQGSYYSQVFLHYVKSRGNRSYAYFDNKNKNSINDNRNIIKPIMNYKINPSSPLEDFINVFENVIPDDLCDAIIEEYRSTDKWEDSKVGVDGGNIEKSIRNCKTVSMSRLNENEERYSIRKDFDDRVFNTASKIITDLSIKYKHLSISEDTGYDLLKYDTGGFYTEHTDSFTEQPRAVSCSFILNDDYEGGEFGFFNGELKYKLKKGSAITFPSNYMFPHEIMPIKKGIRYSIITWFI